MLSNAGNPDADDRRMAVVYNELRAIAQRYFRGERAGHTLQPTALVHEAWLRVAQGDPDLTGDRKDFVAIASRAMRRLLVEHARRRGAARRGGGFHKVTLDEGMVSCRPHVVDLLALDEALEELSALHERHGRVVELRVFGGLTIPEIARVLDAGLSTIEKDWAMSRAWLTHRLGAGRNGPGEGGGA